MNGKTVINWLGGLSLFAGIIGYALIIVGYAPKISEPFVGQIYFGLICGYWGTAVIHIIIESFYKHSLDPIRQVFAFIFKDGWWFIVNIVIVLVLAGHAAFVVGAPFIVDMTLSGAVAVLVGNVLFSEFTLRYMSSP